VNKLLSKKIGKKLLLDEHNRLHGSTWLSKLPSYFDCVNLNSPFSTSNSSGGPVPSKYHIQQASLKDSFWTSYDCRNKTQEKHCKVTKKTKLVSVPATPKKKTKQERTCCASHLHHEMAMTSYHLLPIEFISS
jgi:hypothetical protein